MKRKVVETSQEAYHSVTPEMLTDIYKRILDALKVLGRGSAEQIGMQLTIDSIKVTRRISEMVKLGLIYNTGIKTPTRSGRSAYQYSLKGTGTKESAVEKVYDKNKLNASDYANKIIETANGQGYIQNKLF